MMHVSGNMPDFGSRARRISFAVAVVSVYLLVGAPARSHEPPPVPATEAASATELGPAVINNLQEALAHVAWDTAAHGPLIAVAPGEVMPTWMRQLEHRQAYPDGIGGAPEGPPPLLRLPSGEYTVPDLADYFDLRPVRLRGITVLAPGSMWVLNTPTAPPDPFASVEFGEKCLMLEGTLSPEQWQEFGSDQGLGLSDLQAEQRSLFLSILPDPVVVQPVPGYGEQAEAPRQIVFSGAERAELRLRVRRELSISTVYDSAAGFGGSEITLDPPADLLRVAFPASNTLGAEKLFGLDVRREDPIQLKTQQIDFEAAALRAPVGIAGAATVGDLVTRIREASGVQIYVDKRIADRGLWTKTTSSASVSAGEALRALCWGTAGAVRHVGSGVFVLTDDIQGYGARLARLAEWADPAERRRNDGISTAVRAIQHAQPLTAIRFGGSAPMSEELARRIEESWDAPNGLWAGTRIPITQLPQAYQTAALRATQPGNLVYVNGTPTTPSKTFVSLNASIHTVLLVPGHGEAEIPWIGAQSPLTFRESGAPRHAGKPVEAKPATALPSTRIQLPTRSQYGCALCLAVRSEKDAARAVDAAGGYGMSQIWLRLPECAGATNDAVSAVNACDQAILHAATAAAAHRQSPCMVVAVIPLLSLAVTDDPGPHRTPNRGSDPAYDVDLDILGETPRQTVAARPASDPPAANEATVVSDMPDSPVRNWLRPDATNTRPLLARRLRSLLGVPGLGGIALTDDAPPGYESANTVGRHQFSTEFDLGYTPMQRSAFLKANGYDPIDIPLRLPPVGSNFGVTSFGRDASARSPEMADPSDTTFPYAAWNATRHANLRYLLQSLYPVVGKSTEAALPAPVYLRTLNPNGYGQDWYSRWTTADGIPSNTMDHSVVGGGSFWKPTDAGMAAAKVSQENWYVVRYIARQIEGRELPAATRMALSVNSQLKRLSPTWKGAIIDLSEIPLDRAITLLDGAMPVGTGR